MIAGKARLKTIRKIERITGYRLPDQAFHGSVLEALGTRVNYKYLDPGVAEQIIAFFQEFCRCPCKNSPLCGCPEKKFAALIIDLRERGLDHRQISGYLLDEFGIEIYPADILSFLEDAVHVLEAIRDVARLGNASTLTSRAEEHIRLIER